MRLHNGQRAIGNGPGGLLNGGKGWREFFSNALLDTGINPDRLIALRFSAEQQGVDYARSLPESKRRLAAANPRIQMKAGLFLWGADTYRSLGYQCRSSGSCLFDSVTDPRTSTDTFLISKVLAPAPGPVSWTIHTVTSLAVENPLVFGPLPRGYE